MKRFPVIVVAESPARVVDLSDAFDELGLAAEVMSAAAAVERDPGTAALMWIVAGPDPHPSALDGGLARAAQRFLAAGRGVYAEFVTGFPPVAGPGVLRKAAQARLVVGDVLADEDALPRDTILDAHDALTLDVPAGSAQVIAAFGKVRGVDRVLTPAAVTWPGVLGGTEGAGRWAWAGFRMSDFGRRQFSPQASWRAFVRDVMRWLLPAEVRAPGAAARIPFQVFTEPRAWAEPGPLAVVVRTAPGAEVTGRSLTFREEAPGLWRAPAPTRRPGASRFEVTVARGGRSRTGSVTATVEDRAAAYRRALDRNIAWFERSGVLVAPDGSLGVTEWISGPDGEGNRIPYGKGQIFAHVRADCTFESGVAFLRAAKIARDPARARVGRNLLVRVMDFQKLEAGDPFAGLWTTRGRGGPPYEDDEGWAVICSLAAWRETGERLFLERGMLGAEATLRVFGAGSPQSSEPADPENEHPHDRGQMVAAWLFAYGATGEKRYLDAALPALRRVRDTFRGLPKYLISRTGEVSRWLLPVALAYEYTGDPAWRDEILQSAAYLRTRRAPCGAIQEEGGNAGDKVDGNDLGLTYEGTEPVSDQLYTTSWAAMNLLIAHHVTGDTELKKDGEVLLDYLVRIQARCPDQRVDGGWTRGFDYEKWESHGSNADHSWTAWCMETGWTNAVIDIALSMALDGDPFLPRRSPTRS